MGDPKGRPDWFFIKEKYGGILCDIGSHQIEQFLYYCKVKDAKVQYSQVGNFGHPDYPELEDFGDAVLLGDNGATQHFRVVGSLQKDFPPGVTGRTFILGTKGYIELRKYVNIGACDGSSNHVFLVNEEGEQHFEVTGMVGYPFFGQLILDCINRTENAMTQEHAFKAAELCVRAQNQAINIQEEAGGAEAMLDIAVVGTGNIAPAHIEGLLTFPDRCRIVALCDIYPEKAEALKEKYHLTCRIFDDHQKMLDSGLNIDVIHICTPPYVHGEIAIHSMDAGCHVVVEKPMAACLQECDAMLEAEKRNHVIMACIAQTVFETRSTN